MKWKKKKGKNLEEWEGVSVDLLIVGALLMFVLFELPMEKRKRNNTGYNEMMVILDQTRSIGHASLSCWYSQCEKNRSTRGAVGRSVGKGYHH